MTPDHESPALELVVVGETLIDVVLSSNSRAESPGGSPMNVAIGVSRLGHRVGLLTSIGDDARGDGLRRHLDDNGVHLLPGSNIHGATSTSSALLSDDGSAEYEFSIRWDLGEAPMPARAPLLHTGSIAGFLEPGAGRVHEILHAARGSSLISVDPNIRPSLIPRERTDAVRDRIAQNLAIASVVKLSGEDAEWLYPGRPVDEVLDRVLAAGATLAILTGGAAESHLATRAHRVRCAASPVDVVDTIGAGDSFMAAILGALIGWSTSDRELLIAGDDTPLTTAALQQLGDFATRCAAVTVSRAGANPPSLAEL